MRIRKIGLTNFRNFTQAEAEFQDNCNVILGANAQGKTNLLEAIHVLGVGRSHRDRRDANLVRFGQAFWRVEGTFDHIGVKTTIEVAYGEDRKRIKINGKDSRPASLIGLAPVVVTSPDDIDLIKGAPSVRRSFLDIAISQMSREYLAALQDYWRALAQRNAILRQASETGIRVREADVWDESVVEQGAKVVELRLVFLAALAPWVEENFAFISGGTARIDLPYEPRGYRLEIAPARGWVAGQGLSTDTDRESGGGPGRGADLSKSLREKIRAALASHTGLEVARGYTLFGPHVDDFAVRSGGRDLRLFGSEGEQRTAVLALRAAEVRAIKAKTGIYPIALLDDVFAELDERRAKAVASLISTFDQIVLTSSRAEPLGERQMHRMYVSEGTIRYEV